MLRSKQTEEPDILDLVTIAANQKVGAAIDLMQRYSISQLPVIRDGEVESLADVIGSLGDRDLLDRVFKNPDALHEDVVAAMQPPLAAIDAGEPLDEVFSTLSGDARTPSSWRRPAGLSASSPAQTFSSTWRTTASASSGDPAPLLGREHQARVRTPTSEAWAALARMGAPPRRVIAAKSAGLPGEALVASRASQTSTETRSRSTCSSSTSIARTSIESSASATTRREARSRRSAWSGFAISSALP